MNNENKNEKINSIEEDFLEGELQLDLDGLLSVDEPIEIPPTIDASVAVANDSNQSPKADLSQEKKKTSTKTRVLVGAIVGCVYLLVMLLTTLVNHFAARIIFDVFVISATIVASLEMCRAVSQKFAKPMRIMIIITVAIGFTAFYLTHFVFSYFRGGEGRTGGITAFFFSVAAMFIVCIIVNVFAKRLTMQNVLSTMFVLVYPTMLGVYMLALNYLEPSYIDPIGISNAAILLMFMIPAFSDTGAFVIGSRLKGPKLAPTISPKKTISGAAGGVFFGLVAGTIVFLFSHFSLLNVGQLNPYSWGFNLMHFLLLGGFGAVFVILGDLIASYIKRQCGVKDFGSFLPGHGGMLDRIDSMMLTAAFLFAYFFVLTFFFM